MPPSWSITAAPARSILACRQVFTDACFKVAVTRCPERFLYSKKNWGSVCCGDCLFGDAPVPARQAQPKPTPGLGLEWQVLYRC